MCAKDSHILKTAQGLDSVPSHFQQEVCLQGTSIVRLLQNPVQLSRSYTVYARYRAGDNLALQAPLPGNKKAAFQVRDGTTGSCSQSGCGESFMDEKNEGREQM